MIVPLVIVLLAAGSGTALLWGFFSPGRPSRLLPYEKGFAAILLGVMASGWWSLTLAEFEVFSLTAWAAGMVAVIVAGGLKGWWNRVRRKPGPFDWRPAGVTILIFLILAGIGALIGPPFEYVIGGRDHGVYINTGIHIARTGGILIKDPTFGELPPETRAVLTDPRTDPFQSGLPGPWSEGQRIMGMTIRNGQAEVVYPHAFHLYPAYFALFFAAGGLEFAPYAILAFGLLGLWAVFMLTDLAFGRWIAAGTTALLVVHITTHWFARYPAAEQLLTPLFWGGSWFFWLWLRDRRPFYGAAAGFAFGLMHLAKLDTIFVPLFLLLFFWIDRAVTEPGRAWKPFWIVYLLLAAQAVWHAWTRATIYTIDHLVRVFLPGFLASPLLRAATGEGRPGQIFLNLVRQDMWLLVVLVTAAGAAIWVANRPLPLVKRIVNHPIARPTAALAAVGGIVLFLVWDIFSPSTIRFAPTTMLDYVGGLILVLALVGVGARLWRARSAGEWFLWGMIGIHLYPFFFLGLGTAPDHFWAIRRLIVVYFPAAFLAAVLGINAFQFKNDRWRGLQPLWMVAAVGLLMIPFGRETARFHGVIEYEGTSAQLVAIDRRLPIDSILLFEETALALEIATPLWMAFGHTAFLIDSENVANPELTAAISGWLAQGRPVYWVAAGQLGQPPAGAIANYEFSAGWHAPLVVSELYTVPEIVGERAYLFDFYRLSNSAAEARTVFTLPLYAGDPDQVIRGLNPYEERPGAPPLRWTDGELILSFPFEQNPSALLLMMGSPRPPEAPPAITHVLVNGQLVGEVVPDRLAKIYHFDLSALGTAASTDNPVEVIIRTEPWRPADSGSTDTRTLGIYVPWVKYVTKP